MIAYVEGGTTLASHELRGSYVEAMEPAIVIPLAKEAALRLIESRPEVAWWLIEGLAKRVLRCDERLVDIALKKTPARLTNLVLQLVENEGVAIPDGHKIPTRYTHAELGAMIGASRVAVTRAFNELKGEGAVEVRRHLIYVTDLEALKRFAEAG
jgi:CRP-like cAMP-binding protein